jgi:hypothetical protein
MTYMIMFTRNDQSRDYGIFQSADEIEEFTASCRHEGSHIDCCVPYVWDGTVRDWKKLGDDWKREGRREEE